MGYCDDAGVVAVRDDPLIIEVYTVNLDTTKGKVGTVALVYLDLLQTKGVARAACRCSDVADNVRGCNELHNYNLSKNSTDGYSYKV